MMGNLVDFFCGAPDDDLPPLRELRLGQDPAMVMLFTTGASETRLHWVDDESVKTFVVCPGKACPACHLGSEPAKVMLLPVFDVETREVRVLRVTMRRQAGGLGACLVPHLRDKEIGQKVVFIKRVGPKYTVTARPLQQLADRGEDTIADFLQAQKDGLELDSAFRHMTPGELAEVPSIANKLAAIGTWKDPDAQGEPDASS